MNSKVEGKLGISVMVCVLLALCACGSSPNSNNNNNNSGTPTISLSPNVGTISAGASVKLSWQSTNSTGVTITASTGSGSATRTVASNQPSSGSVMDTPNQSTTYTAVASGPGGTATGTAKVQVAQGQPKISQFTANPTSVSSGQTTTLTWATTNATSVVISPTVPQADDSGPLSASGSAVVPITSQTTFTITATGPGGSASQSLTIAVPLTLSLTASPSTITSANQLVTLSWQVSNGTASALSIDNGGCASCSLPTGSTTVNPTATTTFTAHATAADGSIITQQETVTLSSSATGVIKHIFFMMQENRSLDMYLGQLGAYQPSRLAQFGITNPPTFNAGFNPSAVLTNHNTGATATPFHQTTMCTENLSPAWDESHHDVSLTGGDNAWNSTTTFTDSSFAMGGFLDTTSSVPEVHDPNGTRALGYYDNRDLPYYYDLATFFATSDSWHSPILANTVPNRMYLMAATSFGHEYPDFDSNHPKYAAQTIFHAMNTANVSWLYYYKDGIFLANFADFQDPKIGPKTFPISDLLSRLSGSCSGVLCDPDKALPEVIFIDSASGSSGLDEHPDNNVQKGSAYVQSIISALMNSDAWQDSVFILSYDEGGGLYDHVPPFSVPPPDSTLQGHCPDANNGSAGYCTVGKLGQNATGSLFDLTGFRVPLIVISPYAKPHYVSHTPRDYTAVLAFIEQTFNVTALTARDAYWQDSSRNMSEFFDFSTPALAKAPNNSPWTSVLLSQPTNGVCDQTLESGP